MPSCVWKLKIEETHNNMAGDARPGETYTRIREPLILTDDNTFQSVTDYLVFSAPRAIGSRYQLLSVKFVGELDSAGDKYSDLKVKHGHLKSSIENAGG